MVIGAIAAGAAILAVMFVLAFSKKTDAKFRKAIIIALVVMLLVAIGCMVFALLEGSNTPRVQIFPNVETLEPPRSSIDIMQLVVIIIFLALLFAAIMILAIRERKTRK